ncbi:hypothetical protein NDU88_005370 [Pleurodeles waltl]|uniref:Secreted protein n=1 Tax=Pleurodeles waltl TaxID=8319 RepID=A0AAV7PJE0_PLEWA|nr:hypothetical protein NDU88_005370 [Pleurodeles waltl]
MKQRRVSVYFIPPHSAAAFSVIIPSWCSREHNKLATRASRTMRLIERCRCAAGATNMHCEQQKRSILRPE